MATVVIDTFATKLLVLLINLKMERHTINQINVEINFVDAIGPFE
jgi:hypothetical protein